jgi:hypothetical protein
MGEVGVQPESQSIRRNGFRSGAEGVSRDEEESG